MRCRDGSCMTGHFAAVQESVVGPTRTSRGICSYVGCLRTSGLVMLATRFSESDPTRKSCDVRVPACRDGIVDVERTLPARNLELWVDIPANDDRVLSALICPSGRLARTLSSPFRKNICLYEFHKSEVWCRHPASDVEGVLANRHRT
jgi:hypothetical protein